jgi:hypothetical protein
MKVIGLAASLLAMGFSSAREDGRKGGRGQAAAGTELGIGV